MAGTLHEDQYTFVIITRSILLSMRYVSDKRCSENWNTFYVKKLFSNILRLRLCGKYRRAGKVQMTIWHVRIACWIPKATNTHSECVILVASRLQQWLYKRLYVHCISCFNPDGESGCCFCCSVQAVKSSLQRPYFASGSYSLASHGGRLDSIPGQPMWHLSSTKGYWDKFFSEDFGSSPHPVTHFNVHIAHPRRTNGWNPWVFQKAILTETRGTG
jgi:hypothetical protein